MAHHITAAHERELWIMAGIDPSLLGAEVPTGPRTDLYRANVLVQAADADVVAYWHARDCRKWEHCAAFVRINHTPYELDDSGTSENDGSDIALHHGSRSADCPDCPEVEHATWSYTVDMNGRGFAVCDSCQREFLIEKGIPAEYQRKGK